MVVRADSGVPDSSVWHLLTEPSPGRLAFATRLALICTLVAVFAEVYKTPEIALTVYVVFFLNKPDRTSSMVLTVAIILVITLVIGIIFLLAAPVLESPGLRVLTMALISFVMMFLSSASKLKPVASIVALVIAYALDILGSAPLGEAVTRALLYTWLFFGIPGFVSFVVNLLIAPSPRSLVQKEMAERLRIAAAALAEENTAAGQNATRSILMSDAETQAHLKFAGIEKTSTEEDIGALKGASDCVITVLSAVQLMLDEPQAMPTQKVKQTIQRRLTELADIFEAGGYPAKVDLVDVNRESSDLAVSAVAFLNSGLIELGQVRPPGGAKNEKKSGFFLPDAFTNPVHVQFALKITGAAMLCYLIYSILSWPGIHTALITCFIVSLTTAAESVEKLTLRIVGCLAGAGLGLAVMLRIVPRATDIADLAVILFAGAFLAAWIAAGNKHISYAGFQLAFAYFLCVIQGPSPSFNMVVARDRVIGILLGNIVSYFVATRVWPVSVGPRIDSALQKAKQKLESVLEAPDWWSRSRLVAETQSMVEGISSDIRLAAYEPAWIRPDRARLTAQQRAAEAIRKLQPPMLGVAVLASEQGIDRLQRSPDNSATVGTPVLRRPGETKSFAALEAVLRVRTAAVLQAVSNLKQGSKMDKTGFTSIALLLTLLGPPIQAQKTDQSSSSATKNTQEGANYSRLPDSPSPQQSFVLPPNLEAAVVPRPRTELAADHDYTLTELIDIAELENRQTRVAWQRARNAAIGAGVAASTYLPVITANVLGAYQGSAGSNSSLGFNVQNSARLFGSAETVSLTWLLFDFGGRKNIVDAARKLSHVSNIGFTRAHQEVIYAVSIGYYTYVAKVEHHITAVQSLANAKEVEAAAEARYNHGEGTVIETAQARNLTAQAQLAVVNTKGAEEQAYAVLLTAMGISPLTAIRIATVGHHPISNGDLAPADQIVRDALSRRPDVLEAYNTVQASQASVKAAQAQNRPKIFLAGTGAFVSGQLGLTAIPGIGEQLPTLNITGNQWNGTVLLGVSIPIFDGHRRANAIQQSRNEEDKAAATLDEIRLNAVREIVSAQISLRASLAANDAAATLRATAQTSYDAALDSYKQGVGTVTVAVEAETQLFQARLAETDAYITALSAAATLAYATGQLGSAPR
jgi:outer membrane protein TolC/uncharacterized membrane protein YccC